MTTEIDTIRRALALVDPDCEHPECQDCGSVREALAALAKVERELAKARGCQEDPEPGDPLYSRFCGEQAAYCVGHYDYLRAKLALMERVVEAARAYRKAEQARFIANSVDDGFTPAIQKAYNEEANAMGLLFAAVADLAECGEGGKDA